MTPWLVNEKRLRKGHIFPGELLIEDVCLPEVNLCYLFPKVYDIDV